MGQVKVFLGSGLGGLDGSYSFVMLAEEAYAPMGIELGPISPAPRVIPRGVPIPALVLGPGKLSDALYTLLDRQPLYGLSIIDNVLDVVPTALVRTPGHFLDVPLDQFNVKDIAIGQAVRVPSALDEPGVPSS